MGLGIPWPFLRAPRLLGGYMAAMAAARTMRDTMPVIQFSIPTSMFLELVLKGQRIGLSEHQVAKHIMLQGLEAEVGDDEILEHYHDTRRQRMERKTRAKPI